MGDIERAVLGAQQLEAVLEKRFGADGRGLHEKLSSVEHQLPLPLVKRVRWIASLRNRVVHEAAAIDDVAGFERAVATSRQLLESIPVAEDDVPESSPAPAGTRARRRKESGVAAFIFALAVFGVAVFLAFSNNEHSSRPLVAQSAPLALTSAEALVTEPAPADSARLDGSLAGKARRAAVDVAQAHKDIDELWQTVQRSTKINLGEPDVKDNGDGTSDVLVLVTWSLDPEALLTTLNKYFWDYGHKPIDAGAVDFTDHMGTTAPGVVVKHLWNDAKDQKRPFSDDLFSYLTRNRARIRVNAGKYSGALTFVAGRKCFVSCGGFGHDVFQVHLRNNEDPKVLLDGNDQNPVRIARVPNAALAQINTPVVSVEISQAPRASDGF